MSNSKLFLIKNRINDLIRINKLNIALIYFYFELISKNWH